MKNDDKNVKKSKIVSRGPESSSSESYGRFKKIGRHERGCWGLICHPRIFRISRTLPSKYITII